MEALKQTKKPSKSEQKIAMESYNALSAVLEQINSEQTEIEIEETKDKITIPSSALKFLSSILKAMSQGKIISLVPVAIEVTTQVASEIIGCSRPHLIKLLEEGKIDFVKVGKHRRLKFEDVLEYKKEIKEQQKKHLTDMMSSDEEIGLYDS